MEAETIDLTDPLDNLLRQTGLSPADLQEHIVRLSKKNTSKRQKDIRDMTLSDLLDGYKCCHSTKNKNLEVTETIELSDDDDDEIINDVTNKSESDIEEVTEVRVIEINDDDDGECNDDDDDEFLEESTTDILYSNSEHVYESSSVLDEEDIDPIVNENTSNSLDPIESKEAVGPLSIDRIFGNGDDHDVETLTNSANNVTAVVAKGIGIETLDEKEILLSKNKDQHEKQDDCSNHIENVPLNDQKIKNRIDSIQKISENTLNCKLVKDVSKSFYFNSKSSSSGSSYTSALSELDEPVCHHSSENIEDTSNNKNAISKFDKSTRCNASETNEETCNNKSAFNELAKLNNIATDQANVNGDNTVETLTSNISKSISNLLPNQDLTFNKLLASNPEKENMEVVVEVGKLNLILERNTATCASENLEDQESDTLCNNSCYKIGDIKSIDVKSIRKSIEEIIEQLDLACQVESIENNLQGVKVNKIADDAITTNNTVLLKESHVTQVVSHSLEIDNSTTLLLNSLDEAIKTCDGNHKERNYFDQENSKCSKNLSPTLESLPDVYNSSSKQTLNCTNSDNTTDDVPVKADDAAEIDAAEIVQLKSIKENPEDSISLKKHLVPLIIYPVENVQSDENIASINNTAEESLVKSINVEPKIVVHDQPTNEEYDVVTKDDLPINIFPADTLRNSISLQSREANSNQLFKKLINTESKSNQSVAQINIQSRENITLESAEVITAQLLVQQPDNELESLNTDIEQDRPAEVNIDPVRKIGTIANQTEEKSVDFIKTQSENIALNQSIIPQTNEEKLLDKNIQPVDSKVKKTFMDSISVESNKINSNQVLLEPTNVEFQLDNNIKGISNRVEKNVTDSLHVGTEPCSSKTVNESSLKTDAYTINKDLIVSHGSKKSQYDKNEDSDEDNCVDENSFKSFEEIRKNLKLQLTSLRNRKRIDILQDVNKKVINIELSKKSLLSNNISRDLNLIKPEDLPKLVNEEAYHKTNENLHPINQDLPLSVLLRATTKSESTIGNEGNRDVPVKADDPVETVQLKSIKENQKYSISLKEDVVPLTISPADIQSGPVTEQQEDEDIPNVFNEIRKIIRKQKTTPKFTPLKSISSWEDVKNVGNETRKDYNAESQKRDNVSTEFSNSIIPSTEEGGETILSNLENITSSNSVVISPFVSNTLDEFLTDAKLNVSYTIPKSGAEEGLRQNYSDEPIMPPVITEVKEEDDEKPKQEIKYKPKTLAEKRRLLEKNKLKEKKRLEKFKKIEETQKRSYVLFKDKKIFLKTKSMGKCLASIESFTPLPTNKNSQLATPRKPSLLTELYKKATTPVKYKPGPLCKKHLLQTDYSNWITELQTLPIVTLRLMPQLGKPIHPNLLHIVPNWDGEVTDDQIEFALSALVTKGKQKQNKIFEFNIPYGKQQTQILMRKRILDKPPVKLEHLAATTENSSTSEQDVAEVMKKLINYVEIKEIAPTLITYDKDFISSEDDPINTEVQSVGNHFVGKRRSRFSKTDRELLRLNCKVVSVEIEENEPDIQCSKLYCRLGCICKSLQCERIIGLHCRKVKCIFGCTCPKEKDKISIAEQNIKLPAGTDLLSMDTVTRIEGEAKRNLAKLEKEFTQTVIHTNDKTIVLGFGNKPRRATKTPKKYTFDDDIPKEEIKEPKKEKIIPIRQCSVILDNWDFSDILPYCLVHHLCNCYCRGLSVFPPNISYATFKKESDELLKLKKEEILSASENNCDILIDSNSEKQQCQKQTVEESFKAIIRKSAGIDNIESESDFDQTLYSVTGRPLRKRKKIYEADFVFDANPPSSSPKLSGANTEAHSKQPGGDIYFEPFHCSRTREISKKYYQKVTTFTKAALYFDFANNLTQADLLKALKLENQSDLSESDVLKRIIIGERKKLLEDTETEIHKKKRKQVIQVREDENLTIKTTAKVVPVPKPARKVGKVKSVFKGEIIVNDSEWLKKLGQNAKQPLEGYARILPWPALLNGFLSKSINIYCITDMPLRLLLNVGSKLSGEKILDVETFGHKILAMPLKANAAWLLSQSENVREIVKWLLSGTLPSRYTTTSLSFLLVETFPGQFEVRGLCTQGENKESFQESEMNLPEEGEISDQITEVKHKNMIGKIGSLFITKGKFRLRELVEDGCDNDHTDNLYMWVGLPEVYKVAKWRVVFLNNDFAYLYFKNIKYSIKYTDLVKLTDMAKEEALTLVLRNVGIRRNHEHNEFGIYISQNYIDRIFIGPYFINYDEDEVETLRYINQQLVSSESFNKMTGNPNYRCGHWMYERTYCHTPKVYMKDTIDLTKDDPPFRPTKRGVKDSQQRTNTVASVTLTNAKPSVSTAQPLGCHSMKDDHIIYHNGMSIYIKNSKPRAPSEFNRFIITNIPHFGYLGAYQPENSPILEVSWPFEKKILQFENPDNARDFLQERFNQLLQPVPETFKIQVIVLIQLDLKEHQPINSDFLSGHCICGYFGTYNFREISDEFCKDKLNISKEEITRLFAKRAHAYIRKKIEELGDIVGVNQNDLVNFNVPTILDKAQLEIKQQESIRRQQVSEIQAYELEVVAKMKMLYKAVNILPTKQRNIESKIINEILQIRPKRLGVNEIVEIKDDDDDDDVRPSTTIQSDTVIYNVETDDTIVVPEQPTKKPLKRKRSNEKKTQNPKVAKAATFTATPGPSISVLKPYTALKVVNLSKSKLTNKNEESILLVRPSTIEELPLRRIGDRESITINENTETIIINEDMETVTINEDVETLTFNDNLERVTFSDNIETLTINDDMDPVAVNKNVDPLTDNEEETLTINEIDNIIDDDDDHYIIEYDGDGYDPNVTEIIVSQSDRAENIDLSRATIIASVPPTGIKSESDDPLTVSVATPKPIIKTYSKNTTIPVQATSSKELTGKIKLGLEKILRKSEGNLLLLNDRAKEN